jgi:streptogramin lyase
MPKKTSRVRQKSPHKSFKRPFIFGMVCLLFASAMFVPLIVFAATPTFTEYASPTIPGAIVKGPDGNLWFTGRDDKIGKINPTSGAITTYPLPEINSAPSGIIAGPDGNLWFAEAFKDRIAKITPSGAITEYPVSRSDFVQVSELVFGPDGNIWFTAFSASAAYGIGVMNTNGVVLKKFVPNNSTPTTPGRGVEGISVGSDGYIWFVEQNLGKVVKLNPSDGNFTEFAIPNPSGGSLVPTATTLGPDGNTWFSTYYGKTIGKIVPSTGTITMYGGLSKSPSGITTGPDGNIWFGLVYKGLGKLVPSTGEITEFTSPSAALGGGFNPTTGPDNKIWYTVNSNASKVGKADLGLSSPIWTPPPLPGLPPGSGGNGLPVTTPPSGGNSGPPAPNPSPTPLPPDKLTLVISHDGTTKATVSVGIKLDNRDYIVPDRQVLYVDGSLGIVEVRSGASIKGTGKVGGLKVAKGAILAPGHSPGCLNSGDLNMSGTYEAEVNGTEACNSYDQAKVAGTVTLSGNLELALGSDFTPEAGQKFIIIDNDGQDAVQGTFAGLAEGALVVSRNVPFTVSYKGGDGNDVVLTAAPQDKYLIAANNANSTPAQTVKSWTTSRILYLIMFIAAILGLLALALAAFRWQALQKHLKLQVK